MIFKESTDLYIMVKKLIQEKNILRISRLCWWRHIRFIMVDIIIIFTFSSIFVATVNKVFRLFKWSHGSSWRPNIYDGRANQGRGRYFVLRRQRARRGDGGGSSRCDLCFGASHISCLGDDGIEVLSLVFGCFASFEFKTVCSFYSVGAVWDLL